ncbi:LLM class flavin-dependent oxidoreductase [Actinoplanes sp. NPDC051411]|uniref:LLM class flavin-dependent oxidoreductase n=1 Tax=Actinoplanes sp. NPDC051411 TaxID=3155522 RepID=UPI0034294FD3
MIRIGFMFDRDRPPSELTGYAALLESLGADDLWVVEDLGWAGAIASTAFALAATERLRVGIGIAPVALRNPALLAMELAMLERSAPGRLVAGVGHGVPEWMAQVGASTPRKLALLEETIVAVRGLLEGSPVTLHGREVTIDGVKLVHPPAAVPPIVTGVVQPKSLELSGRVADGTIIAEGHGPSAIDDARGHIERGVAAGSRPAHELIVFAFLRVDDDPAHAASVTREAIAGQAAWLGVPPSSVFGLTGPASELPARIAELEAAGASTVVLRPLGPDPDAQTRAALAAMTSRS